MFRQYGAQRFTISRSIGLANKHIGTIPVGHYLHSGGYEATERFVPPNRLS